ncbi:lysozyme [Brevundimonas sp.]|uniref:lysozyme n=1 Tax=Brevundimonas sp. TaxID=1871086 RepID=UPI003BA8C9E7
MLLPVQGERACIDLGQSTVSEPVMKRLKVSREGIVLIKSFEGFRPRAIRREDGSWIVGYGHTLSAREGASVSEADAELLLQYDLLPVAQAVNETVGEQVNQHQFDALASFAFSVGVERFQSSDVLERIRAGFSSEAADAMVGWPEPAAPEAALRRRAAERALFVADPASPVALADLLSAPLPPPPVAATAPPEAPLSAEAATAEAEPAADQSAAVDSQQTAQDARAAAVAHLLEAPASLRGPVAEPGQPVEQEASPEPDPVEIADQPHLDTAPEDTPQAAAPEPASASQASASNDDHVADADTETDSAPSLASQTSPDANPAISFPPLEFQRYAPYGAASFGALPGIEPLIVAAPKAAASPFPPIEADEPAALLIDFAATGSSSSEAVPEAGAAAVIAIDTAADQEVATVVAEAPSAPAEADILGANASPAVEPLILTPSTDTPFGAMGRLVWPEEQRDGDATAQSPLFDEDAILHRSLGPVVRPEMIDPETADRFSWGEAGAYLLMGGFGLVSFGMSMAALRLASQQSSESGDTTMIAGVLFVIGVACVGVSTYNLYRRWGRPNAD